VTALSARAVMTANTAEPLVVLGAAEEGLQVKLAVTQRQATWFTLEDKLNVYIPILNKTVEGYVSRVTAGQDGKMDVLADLRDPSDDIRAGQLAEIDFRKMSGSYTALIPLGALHADGDRNFIFRIETAEGPLGDEYRLYKLYVRVLDQDDTNVAVAAELNGNDRIVTESDRELFGGRVKITEG
jgi:hypothetical protein